MKKLVNWAITLIGISGALVLFGLVSYGVYLALKGGEFALAIVIAAVLFVFVFLMLRSPKLKNFTVGGKWLRISINEQKNPYDTMSYNPPQDQDELI